MKSPDVLIEWFSSRSGLLTMDEVLLVSQG